jgi:hypothetical protein
MESRHRSVNGIVVDETLTHIPGGDSNNRVFARFVGGISPEDTYADHALLQRFELARHGAIQEVFEELYAAVTAFKCFSLSDFQKMQSELGSILFGAGDLSNLCFPGFTGINWVHGNLRPQTNKIVSNLGIGSQER